MKTIQELAETETASVRGASIGTIYGLQPVQFLKEIVDGAKKNLFFGQSVKVIYAPKGAHDVVIPKRTAYLGRSGTTFNTAGSDIGGADAGVGPYANTLADITWTTLSSLSNVVATPLPCILGITLQNYDLNTNALNLVSEAKEELTYALSDRIDNAIAAALGDAAYSTSTTAGCQTLFGGDATSAATLAAGDVITTDLVAKASKRLKDVYFYYRASNTYGAETKASTSYVKNPWQSMPEDPFTLFIGPSQEEAFRKDSQFTNAAEYGGNTVIMTGEIGKYLDSRIIVTTNVEMTAAAGAAPDATTAAVACTRCILCKPKKACALVWGKEPELKVFDWEVRDEVRIGLYSAYAVRVVQDDAIVFIDVADE